MIDRATKQNNYDLLRLIFALNIFFAHAAVLSQSGSLSFLQMLFNSKVAVAGFFVISGFFIFQSYEKTGRLSLYVQKRIRRVYPLYFLVVCFFAVGCLAISTVPAQQYFSLDWVKYLTANLLFLNFLQPSLPGVFTANPVTAVNGALWAIRIEIIFYALVPLIVFLSGKTGRRFVLVILYLIAVGGSFYLQQLEASTSIPVYHFIRVELAMQLTYFLSGALLYCCLDLFSRYRTALTIAAALVLTVNGFVRLSVLEPLAFSMIVVYLGSCFYYVGNFSRFGDLSYGIFILHFPILQIFVATGVIKDYPLAGLLAALILVLGGSLACWHWIEKPFLHRESHYVSMSR